MIRHLCVGIAGLERRLSEFKNKDKRKLFCWECFGVSEEQLKEELEEMKAKGWDAIPSENCDNHINGHCQGHK